MMLQQHTNTEDLLSLIDHAASRIATQWPLDSFVATNPLGGYSSVPFEWALSIAAGNFGANGLPTWDQIRQMKENGHIYRDLWGDDTIPNQNQNQKPPTHHPLSGNDHLALKYLMAYHGGDSGQLALPDRHRGFYQAAMGLAVLEPNLKNRNRLKELPTEPLQAIEWMLESYSEDKQFEMMSWVMRRLPGWTGYLKHLSTQDPSALLNYSAFRLALEWIDDYKAIDSPIPQALDENRLTWLEAAEETHRRRIVERIRLDTPNLEAVSAQFVFCIDVRSEPVRRHLERIGSYETYGFAGFYGLVMSLKDLSTNASTARCPAILEPSFEATAHCANESKHGKLQGLLRKVTKQVFGASLAAVEIAGAVEALKQIGERRKPSVFHHLQSAPKFDLPVTQQADIVEGMLRTIGLTNRFAPKVVIVGHGCTTTNNAFASALGCGACGGHNGEANARLFVEIANDIEVRAELENRGINIPFETKFVAGLHDTTRDTIHLFDFSEESLLIADIAQAMSEVRQEKTQRWPLARSGERTSTDWAELRPEWGLAGNASIIIGNRKVTRATDLGGRSFLHSYDYRQDPKGETLAGIFGGPLAVAQWINSCYYFSTVDNEAYGAGSKTTANLIGQFGLIQGAIGDLRFGLPIESIYNSLHQLVHYPIRLQCVIVAPVDLVENALRLHQATWDLVANGWIGLAVLDPETQQIATFIRERHTTGGCFTRSELNTYSTQVSH